MAVTGFKPLRSVLLGFILLLSAAAAGCGGTVLSSQWRDRDVTIDGNPADWEGALFSLADGKVVVGCLNDESSLYICAGSEDRSAIRQVMGGGLTLWFDPEGGDKKVFGIRFPLGRGGMEPRPGAREEAYDPDARARALQDSTAELEIIEGDGPAKRMLASEATGIDLKMGLKEGTLAYELRIPLRRDEAHPYAIGAEPGKSVGLGLMTPKMEHRRISEAREGEMPEGGPGGSPEGRGGRRHGGPPGGMRGAGRPQGMPGPLDVWVKIRLAQQSTPAGS